jgi:hypothetical protein
MRVEAGSFKSKADKNGAAYFLHRLENGPQAERPAPNALDPEVPPGGPDLLHQVYSALLTRLKLTAPHRDNLRGRGLTDEVNDRNSYRTLPVQGRARIAKELRERFGDALLQVPGFALKEKAGQRYVTIAGAAGMLVPVRDLEGRIVALKVRRDDPGNGPKYLYVSSANQGGHGPGSPVHVPLGIAAPTDVVRLTEGELKSDLAFALTGLPTIGIPGAGNWRPALDIFKALAAKTVRLALDMDAKQKPEVARGLLTCAETLAAEGYVLELERWPEEHKGIDDLLAAGGMPEVIGGDAALAAAREITAAAGVKADSPTEALAQLTDVLATGGAAAFFRDRGLLETLARLALDNPAEYAIARNMLRDFGVRLRDLDAALKPLCREQRCQRPPSLALESASIYRVEGGCLCRERSLPDGGTILAPLCNFTAQITEVVTRDDGAESMTFFTLAGALASGRELRPVQVPAADFAGLGWVTPSWNGEAVVYAGLGTRDHLRTAIELLSPDRTRRSIYAHTGWRQIGDSWYYFHAGAAIGSNGPAADIAVSLPAPLAEFNLPDPPTGPTLVDGVRASLRLLELGPPRVVYPLLAATYRAVLGETDHSLHLAGPTGSFKSETAALCEQHYGAEMDRLHLPASWSSTGNALEGIAFAAKDALLVVDDFCPTGASGDVQRYHREADRLFRGQGNRAGRQRMRADTTLRPSKPPRGTILSTGEDIPRGLSCRARVLVLEVSLGDIDRAKLTACQHDAAAGKYAAALSGFIRWLAPYYEGIRQSLRKEMTDLRDQNKAEGLHARTPGMVADLLLGLRYLLQFAREVEAITFEEQADLWARGVEALLQAAAEQSNHLAAAEPTGHFVRILAAAIASGRAHVAGPDGKEPADLPEAWGWREVTIGGGEHARTVLQPQGRRVGWVDGQDLYLEPEAAFAEVQELAAKQGESLPVTPRTLFKRLKEKGLLASWEENRERLTIRRTLESVNRAVLHLSADTVSGARTVQTVQNTGHAEKPPENLDDSIGRSDGRLEGREGKPSNGTVQNQGQKPAFGQFGRSTTGQEGQLGADLTSATDDWDEA